MKTILSIAAVSCVLIISSCKKDNETPDPVPAPAAKPDTLSAGWKKVIVDSTATYADIFFNNNTTGYLTGNGTRKSTDGGLTWNIIGGGTSYANEAVTNDGKIFFVDFTNSIYRSVDGGTLITNYTIPAKSTDIVFTDNSNGFTISNDGLYTTADGGVSWSKVITSGLSFAANYATLSFSNSTKGIVANSAGVFKTNGSITNWVPASFTGTLPTATFYTVCTTPNGNVYLANLKNEMYKSTDGGASFSLLKTFTNTGGACDLHFVDNNIGYFSAGSRIYKTTDAGATWNVVVALGEANLVEVHFTDATHGWACGSKGTVLIFN